MSDDGITRVVSFVGTSNSGKTTLLEKVIKELKCRGYRVGVIKHTYHSGEIDRPGKDTWRFAQAGSDIVALSSPSQLAIIENLDRERGLHEIVCLLESKVDIILTEGYKELATAKVLVRSNEDERGPAFSGEILATITPCVASHGAMVFAREDVARIVDLLIERLAVRRACEEMVETF
jgi:molybdopterin-guanine dinucleotide biosynthesis protein B